MRRKLSVVLPTKNEEAVFETIAKIRDMFGNETEIIVVDKSNDKFFNRLRRTGALVIRQTSKGVENAMREGLKRSNGDIVVSLDADGTHDLAGVRDGMELIEGGKADMVLGNRMPGLEEGSMGAYLKLGNIFLSALYDILYGQKVHDVLTGLLVMDRKALDAVKMVEPRTAPIAFFQIEVAKRGFKIVEVPIAYHKRKYGESRLTNSKFLYGFRTAAYIIRSRFG